MSNASGQHPLAPPTRDQSVPRETNQGDKLHISFSKGPKRKRLAKACDPCHKSKRRCDGTSPCSNCYFASKNCTYTDASGRPVPAPRPLPPEATQPAGTPESLVPGDPKVYRTSEASSSRVTLDRDDDHQKTPRKRHRSDHSQAVVSPESIPSNPGPPPGNTNSDSASGLDPALIRELVNLFFTHRHPQQIIIHKPSFSAALSHNRVPAYLLYAVCALAAPLSKQPRIRTNPARFAGQPFAQAAVSLMFDSVGHLICSPNLATAQALCLLQTHETITNPSWTSRYHDIALHILKDLAVHKPDIIMLTPIPSLEFINTAIERECVRRVFWLIHFVDLMSSIYFKTSLIPKETELTLRLPADETSFELAVHSTVPEYLYLPAPRAQYASEFGHLIRIVTIYANVESKMDCKNSDPGTWIIQTEQAMHSWISSLPDHLSFSEDNLQLQMSMFETSSNSGAWCFCCMHVIHASCMLALNSAKAIGQKEPATILHWPVIRLDLIMKSLGGRARNSPILSSVLWAFIKYCQRDDLQIREWSVDHEEHWGIRMEDCVSLERRQQAPAPPLQQTQLQPPPDLHIAEQYGDTARPLRELRPSNQPDLQGPTSSARSIGNTEIDPTLHGGLGPRNPVGGDDPPSLPSLKSSGLLDSWSAPSEPPSALSKTWDTAILHARLDAQPPRRTSAQTQIESESSRPVPSGMPVGMAWLANEPTIPR